MKTNIKLISPYTFIAILLVFCMIISALAVVFGMFNFKTSFAINEMTIKYDELRISKPSEKIKMYFNKAVDHSYREGNSYPANGNVDFRKVIIERIENTQKTIDLAVMYLSDQNLINALRDADKRGVKIRIITDFNGLEKLQTLLQGTNIEIIDNNEGIVQEGYGEARSIMHYKFGLFDSESPENSYLLTGSGNWTERGLDVNPNNLLIIQNKNLVNAYLDEFEVMWGGKFNRDKDLTKHRGEVFEIDRRIVELWMSPAPGPFTSFLMRYVNLFNETKKSIYFTTFNFTLPRLSQALQEKLKEGIDIKGISNDGNWDISKSVFLDMRGITHTKGFTPWTLIPFENIRHDAVDGESSFHYKYFIIDEDILITGASNPTTSAIYTNDEDILVIHDPHLANEAKQNFMSHFKEYGGLTRDSIIKMEDFDDQKETITIKNLVDKDIDLYGWKIVSTSQLFRDYDFFPTNEYKIEDSMILKANETAIINLPDKFLSDNYEEDKFPVSNSKDDGEIYLYDNFAHLQHMIWY